MHKPDNLPRQSLYFDYQIFPVAPLPRGSGCRAQVVVGAGPMGLALALALDLAHHGVRVVVLAAGQQVCEGSRAIVFTRRSLEILQQLGAERVLVEQGLPWRFGTSYYRGQAVFRLEAPHDEHDRFAPLNKLQQVLEAAMVDLIQQHPSIELRWGHLMTGVTCEVDEARLTVDTPQGTYTQCASWVAACDGARSTLRQLQGLQLEGESWQGRFVIADIKIDLPLPTERLAFFDPEWNPGNTVLMDREPFGIWRIDYQLPPDETPERALQPASLAARIKAQLHSIGFGDRT